MTQERIDRELETTASPEAVWAAITDPERLGDWLEADVDLELRPGGGGRFVFADGEVRRAMVERVRPLEELTFSWWRPGGPGAGAGVGRGAGPGTTTVTIALEPTAGGGTRLRFREAAAVRVRAGARALAVA
jgi:uncharacterized protein YndB with AHSA1/START domain